MRGDQDKDGMLSLCEFMLWFHTEIAAALPFKRNGTSSQAAPLYNRFVYYMLVDSGSGVRRKATGLQLGHFLRMCHDCGVTADAQMARNAVQLARSSAFSERVLGKVGLFHGHKGPAMVIISPSMVKKLIGGLLCSFVCPPNIHEPLITYAWRAFAIARRWSQGRVFSWFSLCTPCSISPTQWCAWGHGK